MNATFFGLVQNKVRSVFCLLLLILLDERSFPNSSKTLSHNVSINFLYFPFFFQISFIFITNSHHILLHLYLFHIFGELSFKIIFCKVFHHYMKWLRNIRTGPTWKEKP